MAAKYVTDEKLVHEHGTRPVFRVGRRQSPAADHGRTDHVEESRIDGHDPGAVTHTAFTGLHDRTRVHLDPAPLSTHQRHLIGVRDVQHARFLSEPVGERAVACFEPRRTHRRHRVSTRRDAVKAIDFERGREKCFGRESCCRVSRDARSHAEQRYRKHRRERNLRDDDHGPHAAEL